MKLAAAYPDSIMSRPNICAIYTFAGRFMDTIYKKNKEGEWQLSSQKVAMSVTCCWTTIPAFPAVSNRRPTYPQEVERL